MKNIVVLLLLFSSTVFAKIVCEDSESVGDEQTEATYDICTTPSQDSRDINHGQIVLNTAGEKPSSSSSDNKSPNKNTGTSGGAVQ